MPVVIILDSLLHNCPAVDSFLSFVFAGLWIPSVSLRFLFNRWLFWLIAGSKLKSSLTVWQSPQLRIPEKNHSFSENWRVRASVLSIWSHSFLFCLLIPSSLSLMHSSPWFHCTLPQISSFTLPLYRFCPRHNSRRRSLLMLALSPSDTHYLNRHMVGCGCHAILIQRSITTLLLSNFPLYQIQLWFWWLSYSHHSFQLIRIQCSVHHSDLARNHQSCYQEPFISTSNWRQTHILRYFSCCYSNKACEFIASTVYWINSSSKSNSFVVLERLQSYLPNNSNYRAHILHRIEYIFLYLRSFRIRCTVVSNRSSSPIPCLNANELRTYSDGS